MDFRGIVIITNAPPGAGKDTISGALSERFNLQHGRFKEHLYTVAAAIFNTDRDNFIKLATQRSTKELAMFSVGDEILSPREVLIYVSEKMIKPHFGNDYFGKVFAENIELERGTVASDGGFEHELYPVIKAVGIENVYVIQFTREGADSFVGDSRDWVNIEGVATFRTTNDGTVDELVEKIYQFIKACRTAGGHGG